MSLLSKIQHLGALGRRHGLAAVVRTVAARARPGRGTLYLWELRRDTARDIACPGDHELRFASLPEVEALAREPRWDIGAEDLARARGEDRCLLHEIRGELVGYCWVAMGPLVALPFGVQWPLPPDAAYVYKTLTAPDHRGMGLQALRSATVLRRVWA